MDARRTVVRTWPAWLTVAILSVGVSQASGDSANWQTLPTPEPAGARQVVTACDIPLGGEPSGDLAVFPGPYHIGDQPLAGCNPVSPSGITWMASFELADVPPNVFLTVEGAHVYPLDTPVLVNGIEVGSLFSVSQGQADCTVYNSWVCAEVTPALHTGTNTISISCNYFTSRGYDDIWLRNIRVSGDTPPPFTIESATFDRDLYQNGVDTAYLTVVTRSNWGSEDNLTLSVDLIPSVGPTFHMGDDSFSLSPGEEQSSEFSWAVPECEYIWEFSAIVTLSDASGERDVLVERVFQNVFVGNPLDEATLQQAQQEITDCFLDSNYECALSLPAMVPHVGLPASLMLFVDGMCDAGELHRAGQWEEGWVEIAGAGIAAWQIYLDLTPFAGIANAVAVMGSGGVSAMECAESEFVQGLYGERIRDQVSPGALVDSLAFWISSRADSMDVDFADVLFLEGDCLIRVEADSSWSMGDSLGLNFVMFSRLDSIGSATWVTKNVCRFGHDESANAHSSARLVIHSQANQLLNVGLLHRTEEDTLAFVRYLEFAVTDSSIVTAVVADTISDPVLEVDSDADGITDFLWYPVPTGVEDEPPVGGNEGPILSLAAAPSPMAASTVFFLQSSVDLRDVSISIYNLAGREVRSIEVGGLTAGAHQILWDGRGNDAQAVASGVYYCNVSHDRGGMARTRLVVLR